MKYPNEDQLIKLKKLADVKIQIQNLTLEIAKEYFKVRHQQKTEWIMARELVNLICPEDGSRMKLEKTRIICPEQKTHRYLKQEIDLRKIRSLQLLFQKFEKIINSIGKMYFQNNEEIRKWVNQTQNEKWYHVFQLQEVINLIETRIKS